MNIRGKISRRLKNQYIVFREREKRKTQEASNEKYPAHEKRVLGISNLINWVNIYKGMNKLQFLITAIILGR
jgi:hypothetical protein